MVVQRNRVQLRVSKRREISSIVAVTPDGRLYARHFRGSISSQRVILALRHFRRKVGAPLFVVWDRLNVRRSSWSGTASTPIARDERPPSSPRARGTSRRPTCRPTPRN